MKNEFEIIKHDKIKHLNLFAVNLYYRTPHIHNDFELDIVLNGNAQYSGKDLDYSSGPGDILLINPGCVHEIKTDNGCDILCLQFSPEYLGLQNMPNVLFEKSYINECFSSDALALFLSHHKALAQSFFSGTDKPLAVKTLECYGRLSLICALLFENIPYSIISESDKELLDLNKIKIKKILKYLERNYKDKITLNDISALVDLSPQYLSHYFKSNFGMTFQDCLAGIRLSKAISLISDNNLKLIDICYECGFSDYKYMNNLFLKKYGCSPHEYKKRKQHDVIIAKTTTESLLSESEALALLQRYL